MHHGTQHCTGVHAHCALVTCVHWCTCALVHWSLVCTCALVHWSLPALSPKFPSSTIRSLHSVLSFAHCTDHCAICYMLVWCCALVTVRSKSKVSRQHHPSSYLLSNPIRSKATGVIGLLESISDHLENISESFLLFLPNFRIPNFFTGSL